VSKSGWFSGCAQFINNIFSIRPSPANMQQDKNAELVGAIQCLAKLIKEKTQTAAPEEKGILEKCSDQLTTLLPKPPTKLKVVKRITHDYYSMPSFEKQESLAYEGRSYICLPVPKPQRFLCTVALNTRRLGAVALGYDGVLISPWFPKVVCMHQLRTDWKTNILPTLLPTVPTKSRIMEHLVNQQSQVLDLALLDRTKLHLVFDERILAIRAQLTDVMGVLLTIDFLNAYVEQEIDGKVSASFWQE
jgi:hypothetical protein